MLEFICNDNISNMFIQVIESACCVILCVILIIANSQTDRIQHDSCNASAGSGVFKYNGNCIPGGPALLTLTENSQLLENTVNFLNNQVYFLTSGYFM